MSRHILTIATLILSILYCTLSAESALISSPEVAPSQKESSEAFLLGPPRQTSPVLVSGEFKLYDLNEINDEADTFEFTGVLTLKWLDPRQAFDPTLAGVNEKIFQGEFQFNELSPSWYPQLVLINESGLYETSGVMLRVEPDGTSTLIQTLNATAETKLDMRRFPFDKHRLEAVFQVLGFDKNEVLLKVQTVESNTIDNLIQLPQWSVSEVNSFIQDQHGFYAGNGGVSSAFVVSIDVERKPFFIVRLVIIPLIVIVLLSFSVFWMDRSSLGDRLNVSFIGILTGVAYLLVTSEYLPRISYFTLIHGFLNLSYLTMCATVVINLVVGSLDKRGKSDVGDRVDLVCRWAFPLVYFGLLIVMFGIAILIF